MYNPDFFLGNDTHKLLRDFEIRTDHLISVRQLDLTINKKKRDLAGLWTLLSQRTKE